MTTMLHWLAAMRLPGIGPVTIRRWLTTFENLHALFSASIMDWQMAGATPKQIQALKNPDWTSAERDLRWVEKNQCTLVTQDHESYPPLLREIHDAPLLLYVRGNARLLTQPQLAIVGSRNPTHAGLELAGQFAGALVDAGLVITSGLALGIDAASHRGALAHQGKTIAVLGTGLQHIYPGSHLKLADDIIEQGALVSEFPPNTPPKATNFPLRNRVISGMSLGILVVEAAIRSGSLITARCALEQNREVFAIPGSIHNPLARGCHQLIRQGAKLVETADDVLEELGAHRMTVSPSIQQDMLQEQLDLSPPFQQILQQMGYEVTPLDVIIVRSGLTAGEVSSMLLSLELDGYVRLAPGGYVRTRQNTMHQMHKTGRYV